MTIVSHHRCARILVGLSINPLIELLESRQLLAAGDLDLDFGPGGGFHTGTTFQDVVVQSDGKVVTAGRFESSDVVRRFNADSSPDTSFGGGNSQVDAPIRVFSIETLPTGHILLGGAFQGAFAVAKLNPDGSVDTTFGGGDGIAVANFKPAGVNEPENGSASRIAVDSQGRIVATGDAEDYSAADPANEFRTPSNVVARFSASGELDTSFSGDGMHSIGSSDRGSGITGLDTDAQNRVVFVQTFQEHGPSSAFIYRYTESGQLDTTFSGNGIAELGLVLGGTGELAIQGDGDIVLLRNNSGGSGPALLTFDDAGVQETHLQDVFGHHFDNEFIDPVRDVATRLTVLPDDRIVVVGSARRRLSGFPDNAPLAHLAVARFDANGSPDFSFRGAEPAFLEETMGSPGGVSYDASNDAIVIAGTTSIDIGFVVRLENGGGVAQRPFRPRNWLTGNTIEAEHFDIGGNNIAVSDTSLANEGGTYRNTSADIYRVEGISNDHVVGLTRPGEWLEFTIDVPSAGAYNFQTRYATPASVANYSYMVDGVNVTGTQNFARTGSYNTYATATTGSINLTEGTHVVRLNIGNTNAVGTAANLDWIRLMRAGSTPTQTPFKGTPFLPDQIIEGEDFDNGGQNISFLDTSTANEGGAYRNTAVDLYTVSGASNGHVIGLTRPSEWIEYTVNVAEAGTYSFDTRYATPATTAAYQYQIDGSNVTPVLNFNRTGAYETYATTRTPTFNLSAGTHVIRLNIGNTNAPGTAANIDWLRLNRHTATPTQTPFQGAPFAINTTIQAEDYDRGGQGVAYNDLESTNLGGRYRTTEGVDVEATGDTGGGFNVSHTRAGEWIEYTINIPTTGAYSVQTRLAAVQAGRMHFEVDGDVRATANITPTAGFQSYTTLTHPLGTLTAGTHVLRVQFDSTTGTRGVANVNWLRVVPADGGGGNGLSATYFNNENFTSPAFTRIDPTINFDFGAGSPDPRVAPDTFSIRWSGQIDAPASGAYTFTARADDRARLLIDGVQVVNFIPGQTSHTGSINLSAGRHSIVYEYVEFTGNARASLEWSGPGFSQQVVPPNRLFTT